MAVPKNVQAVFDSFTDETRASAMVLRDLIIAVADETPEADAVEETLRWGQPAYVTKKGSTLRIGVPKSGGCALYAHCQSNIISSYAAAFPGADVIEGNRAVIFAHVDDIDVGRLRMLVHHALTYHQKR